MAYHASAIRLNVCTSGCQYQTNNADDSHENQSFCTPIHVECLGHRQIARTTHDVCDKIDGGQKRVLFEHAGDVRPDIVVERPLEGEEEVQAPETRTAALEQSHDMTTVPHTLCRQ